MKRAIKELEKFLIISIKCGANQDFILGIQNSINALKEITPHWDSHKRKMRK